MLEVGTIKSKERRERDTMNEVELGLVRRVA